jgi:hypothetical protein
MAAGMIARPHCVDLAGLYGAQRDARRRLARWLGLCSPNRPTPRPETILAACDRHRLLEWALDSRPLHIPSNWNGQRTSCGRKAEGLAMSSRGGVGYAPERLCRQCRRALGMR